MTETNGLHKDILESCLFSKALKYGGYDKIPIEEVVEATGILFATTVILSLREVIESLIDEDYNSKD